MSGPTVLVCGGRDFADRELVFRVLDEIAPSVVANGGADGADLLSTEWAGQRRVSVRVFPAFWKRDGKAGPMRNQRMLECNKVDLVVAFPGGRGTADMVARARKAGIEVREVGP